MDREPRLYSQGIYEAQRRGLIERQRAQIADHFNHEFRGMTICNSRFLSPLARLALSMHNGVERILELGPGTGVAAAHMHYLRPEAEIHTAWGSSPINPYLIFKEEFFADPPNDQHATIFAELKRRYPDEFDCPKAESPESESITMDRLIKLRVFDELSEDSPFINRQIVSNVLNDELSQPKGPYDFIYEKCGPLFYSGYFGNDRLFDYLHEQLSPIGIMVVDYLPDELFLNTPNDLKVVFRDTGKLVIKKDFPRLEELCAAAAHF